MSDLTPTERLEWLDAQGLPGVQSKTRKLIRQYETFLATTDVPEKELVDKVIDRSIGKQFFDLSYEFGETMYDVLNAVGQGSKFHRLLVV